MTSPVLPSGDLPEGLLLPDVIITRRTRTVSMSGRIDHNVIQEGTIRFFCRSKGHGFIDPIVKVRDLLSLLRMPNGYLSPILNNEFQHRVRVDLTLVLNFP